MNKFITLAALGLCFSSINAQEAKEEKKAEEGFVSHLSRTRTVQALAGRSRL